MLSVGKVCPGKGQGKAQGRPNAMKPGQLQKSEEALGRLQVVRVQSEVALGPWLIGCKLLGHQRGEGVSQQKAQGAKWVLLGPHRPLPYTKAARTGSGSQPRPEHMP